VGGGANGTIKVGTSAILGLPASYSPTPSSFSVYKITTRAAIGGTISDMAAGGYSVDATYGTVSFVPVLSDFTLFH
jgi:hypothetical protein